MIDAVQFRGTYEAANGALCQYTGYVPVIHLVHGGGKRPLADVRAWFDKMFAEAIVGSGRLYGCRVYDREARLVDDDATPHYTKWQADGEWLDETLAGVRTVERFLTSDPGLRYAAFRRAKRSEAA